VTQSVCRLAIAGNVYLAPFLLKSMGLRAVAIYGAAYLGCIAVILAAPFFATNDLELEETADESAPSVPEPFPVSEHPVPELARMR
jgi:hypothetical protein